MKIEKWILSKAPQMGSSQNPEELSMTVKGVMIALIPIILMILPNTSQEVVQSLINAIFGVVSAVMVLWGVIRKLKK